MTQEDKELLLKDLCARLPYGVKVAIEYAEGKYTHIYDLLKIDNDTTAELRQRVTVWNYGFYSSVISYPLIDCRPYLRSMSSMTEEEHEEYTSIAEFGDYEQVIEDVLDFLYRKHLDFRNLIPKGLALEALPSMY